MDSRKKSRNDCIVFTAIVMVNDLKCAKSKLMIEYREHPNLQSGLANTFDCPVIPFRWSSIMIIMDPIKFRSP